MSTGWWDEVVDPEDVAALRLPESIPVFDLEDIAAMFDHPEVLPLFPDGPPSDDPPIAHDAEWRRWRAQMPLFPRPGWQPPDDDGQPR